MSKKFKVKVNATQTFEISEQEVHDLDMVKTANGAYQILQDGQSYILELIGADYFKRTYAVRLNNSVFTVQVQNHIDTLIEKMGFVLGSSKLVDELLAPMPGLIFTLEVKEGDKVKENDTLLVLEAMKMENSLLSPRAGIIKSVLVKKGDAVDKGQLLIRFE